MIKSNKQEAKIKRLKEELKLKVSMRRCDELYAKISKMGAIIEDYDSQFATIHSQKELTQNEDNAAAAGL